MLKLRRDSLTLVNPCCMAYGFIVVGMAAGPFLRCSMMGRRSSRSMSFVLRRSSAMSVGRALHVELSSAPIRWQRSEERQAVAIRSAGQLGSIRGCAVRPSLRPDLVGNYVYLLDHLLRLKPADWLPVKITDLVGGAAAE